MNKRKLKFVDFEISGKRYKELCGFCEQYPEWKSKLNEISYISGVKYSDEPQPSNHNNSDPTQQRAIKAIVLTKKVDLIDRCAKMASPDLWKHIIRSACYEESYEFLYGMKNLHVGRSAFYERRRYFFFLLDQELKKKDEEV